MSQHATKMDYQVVPACQLYIIVTFGVQFQVLELYLVERRERWGGGRERSKKRKRARARERTITYFKKSLLFPSETSDDLYLLCKTKPDITRPMARKALRSRSLHRQGGREKKEEQVINICQNSTEQPAPPLNYILSQPTCTYYSSGVYITISLPLQVIPKQAHLSFKHILFAFT